MGHGGTRVRRIRTDKKKRALVFDPFSPVSSVFLRVPFLAPHRVRPAMRTGVLLIQLGTPDAPTPSALRPYLRQFLSDPRVIEVPRLKWFFILNFLVLPFRPRASA